ncbi:MAG: FAD:protein FMN transferase [Crocinitomicaceae bacterium]|nr:FAD:protein FMN transferase [Crocinitomicaceae bacterium]
MSGILKHKALIWFAIISLGTTFTSCDTISETGEDKVAKVLTISGNTQGTTYTIIIIDNNGEIKKSEIDEELSNFDLSLSTYIDESVISKINNSNSSIVISDPFGFFKPCYIESQHIYNLTNGKFDPSVFPLVEGWGFMNDLETPLEQSQIDSILKFVSFEKGLHHSVNFQDNKIHFSKSNANFKIDFNAIAQGLSVDVIYDFIQKKGCKNFYVEIGGELKVKGHNKHGTSWNIGVDTPIANLRTRERDTIIHISNKAIATSGNYRKFYIKDGIKYSHTLNPSTGKPVTHSLLSATVIASKCSTADGYATTFMVLGVKESLRFVKEHPEEQLAVYLLYANEEGEIKYAMSDGFSKYLE